MMNDIKSEKVIECFKKIVKSFEDLVKESDSIDSFSAITSMLSILIQFNIRKFIQPNTPIEAKKGYLKYLFKSILKDLEKDSSL